MANNTQTLKPFRSYDEHDVVNLFALNFNTVNLDADGAKIEKGVLVTVADNGWKNTDEALDSHGLGGASATTSPGKSFANTVSLRYGTTAKVEPTDSTEVPLGITLWDMAERDENGEKLLYHPRKAAEMQAVISGQTMPILTKGVVLYKGQLTDVAVGAGVDIFNSSTGIGELSIDNPNNAETKVGKTLGARDDQGYVLLKVEL